MKVIFQNDRLNRLLQQNYRTASFKSCGGSAGPPTEYHSIRRRGGSSFRREQLHDYIAEFALFLVIAFSAGSALYACAVALKDFLSSV